MSGQSVTNLRKDALLSRFCTWIDIENLSGLFTFEMFAQIMIFFFKFFECAFYVEQRLSKVKVSGCLLEKNLAFSKMAKNDNIFFFKFSQATETLPCCNNFRNG
jgi:hypothetical protein